MEFSEEEEEIDTHIGPEAEEELKNLDNFILDDYTTLSRVLKIVGDYMDQLITLSPGEELRSTACRPFEQTVTNSQGL